MHEVALISFVQRESELQLASHLRGFCQRIELIYKPFWRSAIGCWGAVGSGVPFQVAFFQDRRMKRVFDRLVVDWQPDIIHTHLIRMAPYALGCNVPTVLDMTDAVSLYLKRFVESTKNPIKRIALQMELQRMYRFEEALKEFDRCLVCSEIDREFLLYNVPEARIDLLLNGVDTSTFVRNPGVSTEEGRIIFAGNMSYFPNADGARFLVREIFPRVKKEVPNARVFIVGQNPPGRVRSLASRDVVVTGFVEDISTEYQKSQVAVSPVRFGAGTLNKVLEPLAMGIPVVSTPNGVAGLNLAAGSDILVASNATEFADCIVRLLKNPEFRRVIGQSATTKIRTNCNWQAIGNSLLSVYADVSHIHPV